MENINVYKVFYSWQSDKVKVRRSIFRELKKVQKSLLKEGLVLHIEQDTSERIGTKNIEEEVLHKIRNCDAFVADLTPICKIDAEKGSHKFAKLIPNPNVMYECGYALSQIGLDRMILVASLEDGENQSLLPFDINHNTITNIRDTRTLSSLTSWIRTILNDVAISRGKQKQDYECQVFFTDNGHGYESITISPKYRKIQYIRELNTPLHSSIHEKTVMGMSSVELLSTYARRIGRTGSLVPPENIVGVQTYSAVINHTACPIRLTVANIGENELNNLFLFADIETPGVTFIQNNIERVGLPSIEKTDYVIIDSNRIQCNMGLINPNMMISTNKVFLNVPDGVTKVTISWSVLSTKHRQDGSLVVDVKPEYINETQEDNKKVGLTEIVPYKEYK